MGLELPSADNGKLPADTKSDSSESVMKAAKTNVSRKVLKSQQQEVKERKNLAPRLAFFNADKYALYTNQITPELVRNLGIVGAEAADEEAVAALLKGENLDKLGSYFERVHSIVMDILDPEKNPLFISTNKGTDPDEGSKQIVREVMQMVQNPDYRQELRAGFGGTLSEPTVLSVAAYTFSMAYTQDVYYQKNEQLKKQIIDSVEEKYPTLSAETKQELIKLIISKKYPNVNWNDRDEKDSRLPRHLIAIPTSITIAAPAPAVAINGMDEKITTANAEHQLKLSYHLLKAKFPHLVPYARFSKPTIEQFRDTGIYKKIVNLVSYAMNDPKFLADKKRDSNKEAQSKLDLIITNIAGGMKPAWLRLEGEKGESFETASDEIKAICKQNAIDYTACHLVEATFENIRLKNSANEVSPNSVIKYGAKSEERFNKLQEAITYFFNSDVEIDLTNTAGREDGSSKMIAITVTDSSIAPYYDINDYDPNVSDIAISQLKKLVTDAANINPVEKFKIAAEKMLEYYKNMDPKYGKDRLTDLRRIGKVIPLNQYVQLLVEFDSE
jgi:hypothetical protein